MRGLTAEDILALWDGYSGLQPAARALAILAHGEPQADPREHAALPVGARDVRILAIRKTVFGARLEIRADCADCGSTLVLTPTAADLGLAETEVAPGRKDLQIDGRDIRIRAVTAGDLVAVEQAESSAAARAGLLARCVLSVDGDADAGLPDRYAERVEEALEALDPQASVLVATSCPDCEHTWQAPFDAASFLWREITQLAPRLLYEVAQLALRFHWSERDILAMSTARRRFYLEAAGS